MRADPGAGFGAADQEVLRSVVEQLVSVPRLATSPGERHAANLIRQRFSRLGCDSIVEEVGVYRSYAWPIGLLCTGSLAAACAALRNRRALGVLGGLLAAAGIIDDITGGPMLTRRLFMRKRPSQNVVAELRNAELRNAERVGGDADLTLCIVAHHDAAPSGVIFDHSLETWLADHHPAVIRRMTSNPPIWWLVIAGPALVAVGSALQNRRLVRLGAGLSFTSLLALLDIGHRPAIPGANDNLSGVAAMTAAAEVLASDPPGNVRVIFASMGAEETLQEGIRGFARAHFAELPPERTYFVVLDTIGFGQLVLLEAEGPVRLHEYDPRFKDFVTECARSQGIHLQRGLRSRNSTDGTIPQRNGYPTVSIVSVDERKLMPHYHLDSDTSENLDYESVSQAVRLIIAIARRLGDLQME
jgi:Peptidase family M28